MPEGERLLSVIKECHDEKKKRERDPVTLKAILEGKSRGNVQGNGGKKARCGGMEKEKG